MSSGSINIDPHEIDDRGIYPQNSIVRPFNHVIAMVQGNSRPCPRIYRLPTQEPQPQGQPEVATDISQVSVNDVDVAVDVENDSSDYDGLFVSDVD